MSIRRNTRPLVFTGAVLALLAAGVALTLTVAPVPTDAAAGPAAADDIECANRVAEVNRSFGISLTRLSAVGQSGPAERCAAYRNHLTTIESARVVYASCLSGFAREDQIGQLELASSDWRSAINLRCAQ